MFDVKDSMQSEIEALLSWHAQSLQSGINETCPSRCRHFDRAERTDRLKTISTASGHCQHCVSQSKRFWNDTFRPRIDVEIVGQSLEKRAVHGGVPTAAHLIPIVARHFQFCRYRHLHLGEREQIIKSGLPGYFLRQEPEHLFAGRGFRKPGEERVALAWTGFL